MHEIVKFALVENKIQIDSYFNYIEQKINDTFNQMMVEPKDMIMDIIEPSEKVSVENANECYVNFSTEDTKYSVIFSFETFKEMKQLEISINTFSNKGVQKNKVSSEATFIERFKVALKNNLLYSDKEVGNKDWSKCIWLKDEQSQIFATDLYPMIYETENLYRELINQLMVKVIGADWWEKIVPRDLKDEQRSKKGNYKAIVQSLNDVDETLMSIDVSDLLKLTKLKLYKWKPEYNQSINEIIQILKREQNYKKVNDKYFKKLATELVLQLNDYDDLWEKYFSDFLPNDFFEKFRVFSSNRNHVAHNKILDRQSYNVIKNSIINVREDLKLALVELGKKIKSLERLEIDKREEEYDEQEQYEAMKDIMESETGVEIKDEDEIYSTFEDAINRFYEEVKDEIRFRLDLEVSDINAISYTEDLQDLFNIEHVISEEEINVSCSMEVDTCQGCTSVLKIILDYNNERTKFNITFVNGEVSFNDEQGYYMPEKEDEFGEVELENAIIETIDFINDNLQSLKEQVDSSMSTIIEGGGKSPVADIPCCNCGENYICVDENYAEFGRCLNCGEMNDIYECEECGEYCDEIHDIAGVQVCDLCYDKFMNE